ncbi:PstA family ABC transporter permease [Campylobacter sp. MG1]|uniref:PstA family ABC transporter permease n=1 Tax=Campylobacter sp. MG1 TaxID=2976332 RepID=UPI00226C9D62|nr:ABC transporter permease subunit [Campylobacter sp. MG1]
MNKFLILLWVYFSAFLILSVAFFMIVYIFYKGYAFVSFEFLTQIPQGDVFGSSGGIAPAIIGSILSSLIAILIAGFFGICCALYLVFYEKNIKYKTVIHFFIRCIGSMPSIVIGMFGYAIFSVYFGFSKSILSGGLTLAIMIFPMILFKFEKAFNDISKEIILSSYLLGVSKIYTIFKIILPQNIKNIILTLSLAFSYAISSTAAVMFCMAVINSRVNFNIFKPSMSLANHIYILSSQGFCIDNAYATALVLLVIVLIILCFSYFLGAKNDRN